MPLQIRIEFAERQNIFDGEKSGARKRSIKSRRNVPLRQHKPIAVVPLGIFRINAQFLLIQIRKVFGRRVFSLKEDVATAP